MNKNLGCPLTIVKKGMTHVQCIYLKISGRVQGVFFRAHTREEAARLGLKGWVRNTEDGGVETLAEGPREKLEAFVAWCHKGPPSAMVSKVEFSWEEAKDLPRGFHIRY